MEVFGSHRYQSIVVAVLGLVTVLATITSLALFIHSSTPQTLVFVNPASMPLIRKQQSPLLTAMLDPFSILKVSTTKGTTTLHLQKKNNTSFPKAFAGSLQKNDPTLAEGLAGILQKNLEEITGRTDITNAMQDLMQGGINVMIVSGNSGTALLLEGSARDGKAAKDWIDAIRMKQTPAHIRELLFPHGNERRDVLADPAPHWQRTIDGWQIDERALSGGLITAVKGKRYIVTNDEALLQTTLKDRGENVPRGQLVTGTVDTIRLEQKLTELFPFLMNDIRFIIGLLPKNTGDRIHVQITENRLSVEVRLEAAR